MKDVVRTGSYQVVANNGAIRLRDTENNTQIRIPDSKADRFRQQLEERGLVVETRAILELEEPVQI